MRAPVYVVGTDLSDASRAAVAAASALARVAGARIELVCALPRSVADAATFRRRAERAFATFAAATGAGAAPRRILVDDDAAAALARRAADARAALVVVGPSGRGGVARLLLGSVTEAVLRRARTATLVARGPLPAEGARILVALDRTAGAARVLRAAQDVARAAAAHVVAVHVVPPAGAALVGGPEVYAPDVWDLEVARVEHARTEFPAWVLRRAGRDADVEARVVEGRPADGILATAAATRADLVVVGSRGGSALHRFFLGSVAHAVAARCPSSVLVVRGGARGMTGITDAARAPR